jgi:hypothetical protein
VSFEVRVFYLQENRQEAGRFELDPKVEDAKRIVSVMKEFLAGKPDQFREPIPFLKRGSVELEWNAGAGGVAFFMWTVEGAPAAFGAMVAEAISEAGVGVLGGFANTMKLESLPPAHGQTVWLAALPGRVETLPLIHLLTSSLGAVFFAAVETAERPPGEA